MAKAGPADIDAIFEKCSKFFGEMKNMCDVYLKKNPKSKGSRKGGRGSRAKQIKDPNAPKKPITAYILYFKDRKQVYVDQNQNLPITDITKLIGREWKELPKERQQIYVDKAFKDKERYAKEFEAYTKKNKENNGAVHTEEVPKENPKNKKKLHKLSEIKPPEVIVAPKKEISIEDDEEEEEEEENEQEDDIEEVDNEEKQEDEAEEDEEEEEEETPQEKSISKNKRGNFLATSSDNEPDEKIKKKVKK